jgi:hypothetical protein
MACGDPIPPAQLIYRALSWKIFDKKANKAKDIAFLLKPATEHFPAETYLSFGVSPETAKKNLTNIPHVCEITVSDVFGLNRGLQVTQDGDPDKVCVSGMPLCGVDDALALIFAKELRDISRVCQ